MGYIHPNSYGKATKEEFSSPFNCSMRHKEMTIFSPSCSIINSSSSLCILSSIVSSTFFVNADTPFQRWIPALSSVVFHIFSYSEALFFPFSSLCLAADYVRCFSSNKFVGNIGLDVCRHAMGACFVKFCEARGTMKMFFPSMSCVDCPRWSPTFSEFT